MMREYQNHPVALVVAYTLPRFVKSLNAEYSRITRRPATGVDPSIRKLWIATATGFFVLVMKWTAEVMRKVGWRKTLKTTRLVASRLPTSSIAQNSSV